MKMNSEIGKKCFLSLLKSYSDPVMLNSPPSKVMNDIEEAIQKAGNIGIF